MFKLANKVTIVTGASKGIGKAIATTFAKSGAHVVCVSRTEDDLNVLQKDISSNGGSASIYSCDVSNFDEVKALINNSVEKFDKIDVIVNNAGITRDGLIMRMSDEDWNTVIDINLKGTFNGIKAVSRQMMKQKSGRIINISSINAFQSIRGLSGRHYETAKAALVQFTKATAIDWAQYGITVNCICPGVFMTEPNIKWSKKEPEAMKNFLSKIPTQTTGEPDDLGPLAVYISSDSAKYMTGSVIVIDGGQTC